jgi:hypothetical protein
MAEFAGKYDYIIIGAGKAVETKILHVSEK